MNYHERIIRDPRVVGGEPIVKGTRVTLRTVLASLAEGASIAEILADLPPLTEADVRAVIAFAATCAEEDPSGTRPRGIRPLVRSANNGNRAYRGAGGRHYAAGAN